MQGVGFRPYVHRLARELGLGGLRAQRRARRAARGRGRAEAVDALPRAAAAPRRRRWRAVERGRAEAIAGRRGERGVRDRAERRAAGAAARRSPPTPRPATPACASCFDPADRRYRYPFVNCTDCGPRFTIVRGVPYDRPRTTMAGFAMCAACRAEYEDPRDRRFHAQPNACPACGPRARLVGAGAGAGAATPSRVAAARCAAGAIVAVKGLGGYHLACRADDEARGRARCARASTARTSRSR